MKYKVVEQRTPDHAAQAQCSKPTQGGTGVSATVRRKKKEKTEQ
jgi:hypothetical protein